VSVGGRLLSIGRLKLFIVVMCVSVGGSSSIEKLYSNVNQVARGGIEQEEKTIAFWGERVETFFLKGILHGDNLPN
jgi:hypothetical protein